jgi:hypothetical protein|tara:strand:+ start:402 stop:794 length:393 start_codon:yes stop_codon:yes gene_type:complete
MSQKLNDQTFLLYAMKHYTNPQCSSIEDFNEDLNRIKYLKRLFGRYHQKGILKERLILNHIIILGNIFTPTIASRILFFKIDEELHSYLKSFLLYLNYIPELSYEIPEVDMQNIPVDLRIIKKLGALKNE